MFPFLTVRSVRNGQVEVEISPARYFHNMVSVPTEQFTHGWRSEKLLEHFRPIDSSRAVCAVCSKKIHSTASYPTLHRVYLADCNDKAWITEHHLCSDMCGSKFDPNSACARNGLAPKELKELEEMDVPEAIIPEPYDERAPYEPSPRVPYQADRDYSSDEYESESDDEDPVLPFAEGVAAVHEWMVKTRDGVRPLMRDDLSYDSD